MWKVKSEWKKIVNYIYSSKCYLYLYNYLYPLLLLWTKQNHNFIKNKWEKKEWLHILGGKKQNFIIINLPSYKIWDIYANYSNIFLFIIVK